MTKNDRMAMTGHAPTWFPLALPDQFSQIADIANNRPSSDERSKAFLAKVQRVSSTGSFSWRAAAETIMASRQFYRILQLDCPRPLTLALIAARVHPDDVKRFQAFIAQARATIGDFEAEVRLLFPDGSLKYLQCMLHGIRDGSSQFRYLGAVHDATSRRVSEQALIQARTDLIHMSRLTTLGLLTASIVHEVTQPLLGVMTNANTCLRMLTTNPPHLAGACETARRALRDAERACDLVKRLRALFGGQKAACESVNLNEAVGEVLALLSSALQRNRVTLITDFGAGISPVRGDRVQLQQVALNLVLNASEAMSGVDDRPRTLLVRTEPRGEEQVCVIVRDVGVGFPSQEADRLFEAFCTTKSQGLGMGLYISRVIIESHRGRLWAERNDTHGAMFVFSLPADRGLVDNAVTPDPGTAI